MNKIKFYLTYIVFFAGVATLMFGCAGSESGSSTDGYYETTEETTEATEDYMAEGETEESVEEEPEMPTAEQKQLSREQKIKTEKEAERLRDTILIQDKTEQPKIYENPYKLATESPLSTFSIDVDNASYSNIRQMINSSMTPSPHIVRIEEMVNYFDYKYPQPKTSDPFSINTEISACPWNKAHKLVHIGLQGKKLNYRDVKPCNLVFLIDASGSMDAPNKLPLLKKSLKLLLEKLNGKDKIAIVAYAGAAGLVLPSTPANKKSKILASLNELQAGGSTAGGEGIELAYKIAKENLIKGGNNRVILATDGDFNVGVYDNNSLVSLIEQKRKDDIYLTICGFGMGNYKDQRMEMISNAGNGNYFYIDNIKEAEKVFVKEMRANLFTIAKDVKIQIEFNPTKVEAYRLIGYENRVLKNRDFNDDTKDAGELGAGHTVTALYEIIPAGANEFVSTESRLKYQQSSTRTNAKFSDEIMTVKFRYKPPKSNVSKLIVKAVKDQSLSLNKSTENFRFSAAVAEFGLLLRNSKYKGDASFDQVINMAKAAKGNDSDGYRAEFISLVEKCRLLQ